MRYKTTSVFAFLIVILIQSYAVGLYAQSYTIKPILTPETVIIPDTGLTGLLGFPDSFSMNNNGDIVFVAVLSDGTTGICRYSNGNLKLLIKTVIFQALNKEEFIGALGVPAQNDKDEIVFCANLSGKGGIFKMLNDDIIRLASTGDSVAGLE